MTTPIRHAKGVARWRYISGGYDKYWYLRSALRWLSIVVAVTDLVVFGIVWQNWSSVENINTFYLGSVLFIVVVSIMSRICPGWQLSTMRHNKLTVSNNSHCCHS